MKDISNRKDLEQLMNAFYEKVRKDAVLSPFFKGIHDSEWPAHISRIVDFWESSLLFKGGYKGDPIEIHRRLNDQIPLKKEHFDLWLDLFGKTVDHYFAGEQSERIKQRALSMAIVMQMKIYTSD